MNKKIVLASLSFMLIASGGCALKAQAVREHELNSQYSFEMPVNMNAEDQYEYETPSLREYLGVDYSKLDISAVKKLEEIYYSIQELSVREYEYDIEEMDMLLEDFDKELEALGIAVPFESYGHTKAQDRPWRL